MQIAFDGKAGNYNRVPKPGELKLDPNAAYAYFTSNETIQGVQFPAEPEVGDVPLVCDASSDFLSRPIAMSRYGLLFACAQKNAGPAGVTIVIIRDDLLAKAPKDLPSLLNYPVLAENKSLLNTPPTFAIYMVKLVTDWLLRDIGGLEKMVEINRRKAGMLYDVDRPLRRLLSAARRDRQPLDHERALQAGRHFAGRGVPQGRGRLRAGRTQGAPLGGRLPRVDLQRHARGRRRGLAGLHARLREGRVRSGVQRLDLDVGRDDGRGILALVNERAVVAVALGLAEGRFRRAAAPRKDCRRRGRGSGAD